MSFAFINFSHYLNLNEKYIIAPLIFSITIFFVSSLNSNLLLYKILSNSFTVYLGSISYGVYMIHFGMVWFFRQFSRFALNTNQTKDDYLIFDWYIGELMTLIFVIILIFISHLSLKYFENKFR
tara:strand:- start:935 stop:1306 length:372 start_codon:yes stop_codon:yes gene_type:complete